jgi:hypothetical protein
MRCSPFLHEARPAQRERSVDRLARGDGYARSVLPYSLWKWAHTPEP